MRVNGLSNRMVWGLVMDFLGLILIILAGAIGCFVGITSERLVNDVSSVKFCMDRPDYELCMERLGQ
mgnify:CR=1 FL=1